MNDVLSRWCIGGPMHGEEAPGTAYGPFTVKNSAGEEAAYHPARITVDDVAREYYEVGPQDPEWARQAIRNCDSRARPTA